MSDTSTNTTDNITAKANESGDNTNVAKPTKPTSRPRFNLVKNHESGFWELTTPTITYIIAEPTEDWLDVVYKLGRAVENYYGKSSEMLPESIREVGGIKQLIGGW